MNKATTKTKAAPQKANGKTNGTKANGWTRDLSEDQTIAAAHAADMLGAALNVGDFALAHRLLVAIEVIATGTDPDLAKLCEPRGYQHFKSDDPEVRRWLAALGGAS